MTRPMDLELGWKKRFLCPTSCLRTEKVGHGRQRDRREGCESLEVWSQNTCSLRRTESLNAFRLFCFAMAQHWGGVRGP